MGSRMLWRRCPGLMPRGLRGWIAKRFATRARYNGNRDWSVASRLRLNVWFAAPLTGRQSDARACPPASSRPGLSRYETALRQIRAIKLPLGMVEASTKTYHPWSMTRVHVEADGIFPGERVGKAVVFTTRFRLLCHRGASSKAGHFKRRQPPKDGRYAGRVRLAVVSDRSRRVALSPGSARARVAPGIADRRLTIGAAMLASVSAATSTLAVAECQRSRGWTEQYLPIPPSGTPPT